PYPAPDAEALLKQREERVRASRRTESDIIDALRAAETGPRRKGAELLGLDAARQDGGALCVAFAPDSKLLASGDNRGGIKLWDLRTGTELRRLAGHGKESIHGLAFSPDGTTLASTAGDGTVRLWDVSSGEGKRTIKLDGNLSGVAFSPDGSLLASYG